MSLSLAQRQALRRGADPGRVLGAAAGAALAAAGVGYAAEAALITLNPAFIIPGLVLLIGELTGLIPSFAGKPKLLDTIQAVQRLAQSSNPAVQQLAQNIGIYAKNGVPLSTSNPQQQSQLRSWIGGTVATLLAQRGITPTGQNVELLDQAIRNVLTSEIANSGTHIDATLNLLGGQSAGGGNAAQAVGLSARRPGPQLGRPLPQPQPLNLPQVTPQPGYPQSDNQPRDLPRAAVDWLAQSGLLGGLGTLSLEDSRQLGHCVLDFIRGHEVRAIECVTDLAVRQIGQAASDFLKGVRALFTRQPQPAGPPPGLPVPILDQTSDCPSCTPRGRLQKQLQEQEQRTLRDIEREQGQLTEEQLSQQSDELSKLEQFETQPASQRDIQKELSQKNQVLQQIRQEQSQIGGQPAPQPSGPQPAPGQPAPQLQPESSQTAQREIESELHEQHDHTPVQFCVGCKSQEDAILFLNGEPSQCSVIPGSTKEVNYG